MDPITATLMAANIGGGLLGLHHNKPKTISPEWLKQHFGAGAVNDEMVQLFNHILASPVGQQMMTSAAEQGSQFQNQVARNMAAAGMGPSGGADSGASIFSGAAAGGATNALQRQGKADIMAQAMPVAQQMVSQRMALAAGSKQSALDIQNARPSGIAQFGNMLATGANAAMASTAVAPPSPLMQLDKTTNQYYPTTNSPSPLLNNVQNPGKNYLYPNRNGISRLANGLAVRFATTGARR